MGCDELTPAGCPWPVILGVDPGTRVTGWGAIVIAPDGPRMVACGVIQPAARGGVPERLGHILAELEELLDQLKPTTVVVEGAFHGANARSALRLGEARGLALASAARRGCAVAEISPAAAKLAIVGHGRASKEQVADLLRVQLDQADLEVPQDATDGLALALAHHHRDRAAAGLVGRGLPR